MGSDPTRQHAAALAAITRAITISLNVDAMFRVLEREAQAIVPHDRLWVLLRSNQSDTSETLTVAFSSPRHNVIGQAFLPTDTSFGPSLLVNRLAVVQDFAATAPTYSLDRAIVEGGDRAGIVVPIQVASTTLGCLLFTHARPDAYTWADIALIEPVAGLLALALEHQRLVEETNTLAVVEERNRLAREIHDTLAQSLTAIILNLESLQLNPYKFGAPDIDILAETEALARSALVEARRSVLGLQPTPLAYQSLAQALASELADFGERSDVTTELHFHGTEQKLAPDQATALFRIAHEALQNVAKYAAARTVRIALAFATDTVTLTIEDDGVGFDRVAVPAPDVKGGSGLLGMEARTQSLGGSLDVASSPGHGTLVQATLPYARAPIAGLVRVSGDQGASLGEPIRVLVVDDHPVTRQGLRRILESQPDLQVVGEAEDGLVAVDMVRSEHPNVVLLDLQMPRLGGLAALPQLRATQPGVEVVVLTTFDQEEHVFAALKAGARGYVVKDASPETLLATIRAAARGESWLPAAVATRVVERFVVLAQRETDPDALNARELEILRLMAKGRAYKEIAAQLHIATKTVQYHVGNILGKLHVRSRGEAVAVATERGLLGPSA